MLYDTHHILTQNNLTIDPSGAFFLKKRYTLANRAQRAAMEMAVRAWLPTEQEWSVGTGAAWLGTNTVSNCTGTSLPGLQLRS